MNVVQISTSDEIGGAALAAKRLHEALNLQQGVKSTTFVAAALHLQPGIVEYNPFPWGPRGLGRFLFRAGRWMHRRVRPGKRSLFTEATTSFGRLPNFQIPPADIYHLHWVADLLDFRMLPELARRAPLVWTFHDMNPFTGGCHYDDNCGRYIGTCGQCPLLHSTKSIDRSTEVQREKMQVLERLPAGAITVVAPSQWMADESKKSSIFSKFSTRVIPNGIDLDAFCPVDRTAIRQKLGFSENDRVVLFVAEHIDDRRKGWRELRQALEKISYLENLKILTLGAGDTDAIQGLNFHHLGPLHHTEGIRDAYNAADVFVVPSLQDNFPNTVLESLACGTPVVGFASGGVPDAVIPGINGFLAPTGDIEALAVQIEKVLTDTSFRQNLRSGARNRAVENYGIQRQADAVLDLYRNLIAKHAAKQMQT